MKKAALKRTGARTVSCETDDCIVGYKLFRALVALARYVRLGEE